MMKVMVQHYYISFAGEFIKFNFHDYVTYYFHNYIIICLTFYLKYMLIFYTIIIHETYLISMFFKTK